MTELPELLLIDKPSGITSMDVIRRLRRKLEIKKMGHAGTLDPLATGLMLIGMQALSSLVGTVELPVSAYSAIKVDGVPMYKRARSAERKGETIADTPPRSMRVDSAELLKFEIGGGRAVATVRFSVGSGTYIRSLGEELGRRLNYPATLQALRRTKVGTFRVEDATPV
jgi:tRNA pseudouridine55 synthase